VLLQVFWKGCPVSTLILQNGKPGIFLTDPKAKPGDYLWGAESLLQQAFSGSQQEIFTTGWDKL